mmetsp:Transcript_36295/g.60607  ORF Transcript_36295/g.60607 Transcript_36295/m.60607 type:complete len:210 (-) Transcript_36295:272-901(-)
MPRRMKFCVILFWGGGASIRASTFSTFYLTRNITEPLATKHRKTLEATERDFAKSRGNQRHCSHRPANWCYFGHGSLQFRHGDGRSRSSATVRRSQALCYSCVNPFMSSWGPGIRDALYRRRCSPPLHHKSKSTANRQPKASVASGSTGGAAPKSAWAISFPRSPPESSQPAPPPKPDRKQVQCEDLVGWLGDAQSLGGDCLCLTRLFL